MGSQQTENCLHAFTIRHGVKVGEWQNEKGACAPVERRN